MRSRGFSSFSFNPSYEDDVDFSDPHGSVKRSGLSGSDRLSAISKVGPTEWVILELGPMAEGEDPDLVSNSIRHILGAGTTVFIPAVVTQVGDDRVVHYLVEGYAFVKPPPTLPSRKAWPLSRLEDSRYVQSVVRHPSDNRSLALIHDRDVEKFRRQMRQHSDQGIDVGDTVVVNSGAYKNLTAVVVEDIPEQDAVQVRIELRSKDSLITLPRSFLHLSSKASLPSYVLKVREHRAWFDLVQPVLRWDSSKMGGIARVYGSYRNLNQWITKGRLYQAQIRLHSYENQIAEMRKLVGKTSQLTKWLHQGTSAQNWLKAWEKKLDLSEVTGTYRLVDRLNRWSDGVDSLVQWVRTITDTLPWDRLFGLRVKYDALDSFALRWSAIEKAVVSVERALNGNTMIENLVVDGLNMLSRCALAPGLGDLRDSKGRPTGAIVGFLHSLTALKKKHPGADIWVCWDNSSTRRKTLYPEYKANRNSIRSTFEVSWLKDHLQEFGVWQAQAEGEEADDVVAALVRGRLEGQRNLIVSNDRDFMQLVTATTQVLVPAVGVGKEKLCTPEVVLAEYGVPPEKMVHFRALGGDTSDNIPGAPGCGSKTASKLLQLYGTIDGIFVSNLAGLSQSLRDKLRGAEKQVRLNVQLMSLVSDLDLGVTSPATNKAEALAHLADIEMSSTRIVPVFFQEVSA